MVRSHFPPSRQPHSPIEITTTTSSMTSTFKVALDMMPLTEPLEEFEIFPTASPIERFFQQPAFASERHKAWFHQQSGESDERRPGGQDDSAARFQGHSELHGSGHPGVPRSEYSEEGQARGRSSSAPDVRQQVRPLPTHRREERAPQPPPKDADVRQPPTLTAMRFPRDTAHPAGPQCKMSSVCIIVLEKRMIASDLLAGDFADTLTKFFALSSTPFQCLFFFLTRPCWSHEHRQHAALFQSICADSQDISESYLGKLTRN